MDLHSAKHAARALSCCLLLLPQVLKYLSGSTLGAKSSEEHMAALQSKVVVSLGEFKTTVSTVQKYVPQQQSSGKEVKKNDSGPQHGYDDKQVAAIKDLVRNQFGATVVSVCGGADGGAGWC
jgi:hypothetical protein